MAPWNPRAEPWTPRRWRWVVGLALAAAALVPGLRLGLRGTFYRLQGLNGPVQPLLLAADLLTAAAGIGVAGGIVELLRSQR